MKAEVLSLCKTAARVSRRELNSEAVMGGVLSRKEGSVWRFRMEHFWIDVRVEGCEESLGVRVAMVRKRRRVLAMKRSLRGLLQQCDDCANQRLSAFLYDAVPVLIRMPMLMEGENAIELENKVQANRRRKGPLLRHMSAPPQPHLEF